MVKLLVEGLPHEGYAVIPNVEYARKGGHPYEYDALVVSPHAIYVVEIKGWNGSVRQLNRKDWELSGGVIVPNPVDLTQHKARVLLKRVKEFRPEQADSLGWRTPYVQACVLIADEQMRFDVGDEWLGRIFTPGTILDFLTDPQALLVSKKPAAGAHRDYLQPLIDHLCGVMHERPSVGRRYGSYVTTDVLALDDDHGEFFARHSQFDDGHKYYVRTWYVSPYMYDAKEREERIRSLQRGAEVLNRAGNHPNLVELRDAGMKEDTFYEVTRWPAGGKLSTAISLGRHQQMSVEERLELILGVVRGLAAAQDEGVHHRNLTPEVILLEADGTPRVGGFDRALLTNTTHTVYGQKYVRGPNEYIAPELRDPRDYDSFPNTDLYSVGIIGFELLTGVLPSMSRDALVRMSAEIPAQIRDDLVALVNQMREREVDARPASLEQVQRALEDMLKTLRGEITPAEAPPQPKPEAVSESPTAASGDLAASPCAAEPAAPQPAEDVVALRHDPWAALVRPAMDAARAAIWTADFVEQLTRAQYPWATIYDALRAYQNTAGWEDAAALGKAFVTSEAQIFALEAPLAAVAPSFYDGLLVARGPLEVGDGAPPKPGAPVAAPAPVPVGAYDMVLVLDGLNLWELRYLKQRAHALGRVVREYSWVAGSMHPGVPAEGLAALNHALSGLPEVLEVSPEAPAPDAWPDSRALRTQLPCAMPADAPHTFEDLLALRRTQVDAWLDAALGVAEGRILVTSTWGTIYPGHGLSVDVATGAGAAAQGIRALWTASFPDALTRVGSATQILQASIYSSPYRDAMSPDFATRRFPAGRLTWGNTPPSPRLLRGGLSLAERVLPLLVMYPDGGA